MKMKTYLCSVLRSRRGYAESLEFIGVMAMLMAIFYVLMMAFTPFMMKVNVDAFTKTLVRQIEIHGAIDDEIKQFADELADTYELDPEITYDATYINGTNHIQIRNGFKVSVTENEEIKLLNGSMFNSLSFTVPIADEKVGISEKLWK